jgi:isopenicillin N synthase-like dioxygenase
VVPAAARRRSVAFFLDANYDATISCLPTCVDEANPARYAPFIAGDHLMAKILGPRTGARSKAVDTAARRGPGAGRPAAGVVRGARPG